MKSQFNSDMSNSPFYIGPSVYVDRGGWSFFKKERKSYKFIIPLVIVSIAVLLMLV